MADEIPRRSASSVPLEAFVPGLTLRRLARDPARPEQPSSEPFETVVLFSDISGFTALTEHLGARGPRGAEEVKEVLNACFGPLVDLIVEHGGSAEKFAGDAVLALWPVERPEDLPRRVQEAAGCCLEVFRELDGLELIGGFQLRLRAAITAGRAWHTTTGGVGGRWETLVIGDALDQIGGAVSQARPGDLVLSPQAWAPIVTRGAEGTPLAHGCFRLRDVPGPSEPEPAAAVLLDRQAQETLRCFVPFTMQSRLDAGQTGWLAEFRRVTILFAGIEDLELVDDDALDRFHDAIRTVQHSIYRFGGSVNQLVRDDKGLCVVAAWGVAFRNYDDNAVRALRAAREVERTLDELGVGLSVGVASGRIYTGLRGSNRRVEYAMIGDAVNLAARLMESAESGILCDRYTQTQADDVMRFEPLEPIRVKGKEATIQIFRPLGRKPARERRRRPLIGRDEEQAILRRGLERLLSGKGSTLAVVGEAGVGKTHLVDDFLAAARETDARIVVGHGDAIEQARTFFPMAGVFEQLLGFDDLPKAEQRPQTLYDFLLPEEHELAPLLNPVLPFELEDTPLTADLTTQARAAKRLDLMVALIGRTAAETPTVLVIEDAHWLDSASWKLLRALHGRFDRLLLLVDTRPLRDRDLLSEGGRLVADGEVVLLELGPLDPRQALDLVRRRLGVDSVPEALAELLLSKAEGHPFFTEELLLSLRDQGLIRVENGRCILSDEMGSFSYLSFPDTAQGVVTGRLDILNPQEQLTLKVASVIGRRFDTETLEEIHPIPADRGHLPDHLDTLTRLELIQPLDPHRHTYEIKHSITQEAAYQLLSYAQRRELHRAVAEWNERRVGDDRAGIYSLLAHHWTLAEDRRKSLEYLEKAGEQAESGFAYKEVARFFGRALELDASGDSPVQDFTVLELPGRRRVTGRTARRARWRRKLGFAKANLDQLEAGAEDIEQSLVLLGEDVPDGKARLLRNMAFQVARQTRRRLRGPGPAPYSEEARRLLLGMSRAYSRLGSYSYVSNDRLRFMYFMLAALNTAEQAGPSPELAAAYADISVVAGLVPLHGLARAYVRSALDTAAEVDQDATTARVHSRTSIYLQAIGDWSVRTRLEHAIQLSERIGDPYQWEESAYLLGQLDTFQGRYEPAEKMAVGVEERSRASGTLVHELWGAGLRAECFLRLGRLEEAVHQAEETLESADGNELYRDTTLRCHGVLAETYLRQGRQDLAERSADDALAEIRASSRNGHLALQGYVGCVEVYLRLLELRGTTKTLAIKDLATRDLAAKARHALRRLQGFISTVPVAGPRALAFEARLEATKGRTSRARRRLEQALAAAESYDMPYEQGRVHAELGRLPTLAAERRRDHLQRAADLFEELGTPWDAESCRRLVKEAEKT